ncbi:hypothetical protein GEMRC1_012392 [Eukaryota sp. GEM-RC1]
MTQRPISAPSSLCNANRCFSPNGFLDDYPRLLRSVCRTKIPQSASTLPRYTFTHSNTNCFSFNKSIFRSTAPPSATMTHRDIYDKPQIEPHVHLNVSSVPTPLSVKQSCVELSQLYSNVDAPIIRNRHSSASRKPKRPTSSIPKTKSFLTQRIRHLDEYIYDDETDSVTQVHPFQSPKVSHKDFPKEG